MGKRWMTSLNCFTPVVLCGVQRAGNRCHGLCPPLRASVPGSVVPVSQCAPLETNTDMQRAVLPLVLITQPDRLNGSLPFDSDGSTVSECEPHLTALRTQV